MARLPRLLMLTPGSAGGSAGLRVALIVPERVTAGATGAAFSLAFAATVRLGRDRLDSSTPAQSQTTLIDTPRM